MVELLLVSFNLQANVCTKINKRVDTEKRANRTDDNYLRNSWLTIVYDTFTNFRYLRNKSQYNYANI